MNVTTSQLLDKPGPRTIHRFMAALTQQVKEKRASLSAYAIRDCGFIRLSWDTGLKYFNDPEKNLPIIATSCPINFLCNIEGSCGHMAHASYLHLTRHYAWFIAAAADTEREGTRCARLRKAMLAAIQEGERQWRQ